MNEKIYTFPSIEPQKPMSEEEFDKWAEIVVERHNAISEAYESGDVNRVQAELAGLGDHLSPLILLMWIFGSPNQFKKTTKEEVKKKYAYKVNPELYEECKEKFLKETYESLGIEEVEYDTENRKSKSSL